MPPETSVPPGIVYVPVKVDHEFDKVGAGLNTWVNDAPPAPSPKSKTLKTTHNEKIIFLCVLRALCGEIC